MPKQKTQNHVVVTSQDAARLKQLLERAVIGARDQGLFERLEQELEVADVVQPEAVPADVITIHSTVRVRDLDTGEEATYTLVMPRDAYAGSGKISIIAPVGIALLGQKVGDRVELKAPGGLKRLKVMELLYQPEAAGDYHL